MPAMLINPHTKISTILRKAPESLYVIVQLSPKFSKLRNPILRKVMAPRVTIAQAANIGGCTPQDFYNALRPLGFMIDDKKNIAVEDTSIQIERPDWLANANNDTINVLDVRPILAGKEDPLNHILDAVKMLGKDEILCIINTFEPTPLIQLLGKKGYAHHLEKLNEDEIKTYFKKTQQTPIPTEKIAQSNEEGEFDEALLRFKDKRVEIDVRDMEMPKPMLTIMEKIAALQPGYALYVNHKRVPVYLLPELQDGGFTYHIKQISEGDVKLLIYRK